MWFAEHGERELDVVDFSVDEPMSAMFSLIVRASTQNAKLTPSGFMGKGPRSAFATTRATWSGHLLGGCAGEQPAQRRGHTVSVYEFSIVPALWRTTLRRNNRIFQRMKVREIIEKILGEWKIPCTFDLKGVHRTHDHRVQYHESDYAFMARLLEEEGTSYWFDHAIKSGAGSAVTSILCSDKPQTRPAVKLKLPYRAGGETFVDGENVIFDVKIGKQMRFGKATIRDFDSRLAPRRYRRDGRSGRGDDGVTASVPKSG